MKHIIVLLLLATPVLGADGTTGLPQDTGLYGDPFAFFKTLPAQVQYLVVFILTFAVLVFVVSFFLNVFGSGSKAQVGAVSGNVGMRNSGTSGIFYGIWILLAVIISVVLFLYLF